MEDTFLGALHADPWVLSLIDLPELNEAASALIEERVGRIREVTKKGPAELRSESLVLLGPPGTGKTHLFARVRKNLGPRAAFVHIRPLLHAGLTPSYVLGQAVQQLAQPSFGRTELQADMLVGSMIGYLEDRRGDYPAANLSTFKDLPEKERGKRLEQLSDRLFDVFADLDDVFVERLLALPFAAPRHRRALLAWLLGQDCDPSQLGRIGAATSMDPSNAVRALRTLASVAALGSPLVLVFDQLENLVQRDGSEERITQYGNLVAELIDSTRGLLVVQLALDSEWEQAITPQLNLSQRSRLVMTKAALTLPIPKQSRGLLELWCGKLEAPEQPFPWPLSAQQLERLCALPGVTPRMLLSALKEAREGSEPSILQTGSWRPEQGALEPANDASSESKAPASTAETDNDSELNALLAEEWLNQLATAHLQLDQADARGAGVDEGRLRDAILLASTFGEVSLRGVTDPYIQLESKAAGGKWVCLLHQAHFRSLNSALDRVLARGPQAPGLIVREQWRAFPPTWKSVAERQTRVLAREHLAWHELSREEAAALLALEAMLQLARSRDICDSRGVAVTEAQVVEHLRQEVHPERWAVIARLAPGAAPSSAAELAPSEGPVAVPEPPSAATAEPPVVSPSSATANGDAVADRVLAVVGRLRVCSVDRVIREVHRLQPGIGRAAVVSGLEGLGDQVQWFGRNIVAAGGSQADGLQSEVSP